MASKCSSSNKTAISQNSCVPGDESLIAVWRGFAAGLSASGGTVAALFMLAHDSPARGVAQVLMPPALPGASAEQAAVQELTRALTLRLLRFVERQVRL